MAAAVRVVAVQCVDRCAATVGAGRGPAPRERGGEAHLRLVRCGWLARRVRRMELKQAQTLMGYRATTFKLERFAREISGGDKPSHRTTTRAHGP